MFYNFSHILFYNLRYIKYIKGKSVLCRFPTDKIVATILFRVLKIIIYYLMLIFVIYILLFYYEIIMCFKKRRFFKYLTSKEVVHGGWVGCCMRSWWNRSLSYHPSSYKTFKYTPSHWPFLSLRTGIRLIRS